MATATEKRVPALRAGDHLTVEEFERRYEAMPHVKKAELINGVVYMPSPVSTDFHASPHFDFIYWLGHYKAFSPGTQGGDNGTLRLKVGLNQPQPDAFLRILPEYGGQSQTSEKGYVVGAPEWLGEVSASSASFDLHEKLEAYKQNGACEYVVWRVEDRAVDWFVLRGGQFEALQPGSGGLLRSEVFPGLWLDAPALLRGDLARVFQVVQLGLATPEHVAFLARLAAKKASAGEVPP